MSTLGHSFGPPIHTVDELDPRTWRLPDDVKAVSFENIQQEEPELDSLHAAIARQSARRAVAFLRVGWNSRLVCLDIVGLFPAVEHVSLEGRWFRSLDGLELLPSLRWLTIGPALRPRRSLDLLPLLPIEILELAIAKASDTVALSRCRTLERLRVDGWREAGLAALAGIECRSLFIVSRRLQTALGANCRRLHEVRFAGCPKLISLEGLSVETLSIHACRRLPLDAVAAVRGMKHLELLAQPPIQSFEFIRSCPELQTLIADATAVRTQDIGAIVAATQFERLSIALMPDRLALTISTQCPRLRVENGRLTALGGKVVGMDGEA